MREWGFESERERPGVLSGRMLIVSAILHVLVVGGICLTLKVLGWISEKEEKIIPIDLTVVVNENLNGEENEPPPLKDPPKPKDPPPKPPPKPKDPPKIEPPKPLEQITTNIVQKVDKKKPPEKKPPEKKPPEKKDPPAKPVEKPKTKEELRAERLAKMREDAVKNKTPPKIVVNDAKKSGNGKTEKQTLSEAEIRKLLDMGYVPSNKTQLASGALSLGVSQIQMALNAKWEQLNPKVGASGVVLMRCRVNSAGGLVNVRLEKSCGDSMSDQAALSVARSVSSIRVLSDEFKKQFYKEDLVIRYKVEGK